MLLMVHYLVKRNVWQLIYFDDALLNKLLNGRLHLKFNSPIVFNNHFCCKKSPEQLCSGLYSSNHVRGVMFVATGVTLGKSNPHYL